MAGPLNVVDSGTNDTIDGINSPMTVTASAGSTGLLVFGATVGGLDFLGGNSSATVFTGAGTNTIAGGTGGLLLSSGGNDAVSGAAPGGATLFGTSNSSVTYTGAGNLLYAAGAGNETLNAAGSTGNNYFVASSIVGANDSITAGSGSDTMIAGAGSDTFSGGPGADTFAFFSQFTAGSHDFITGLTPGDNVALGGYGSAATSTSTSNGSTTITLADNTQITFVNVTNPANVHFG
jgi:Ca2+-binding RTX toxin-like protein